MFYMAYCGDVIRLRDASESIEYLRRLKVSTAVFKNSGWSLLHQACIKGQTEVVRMLVCEGASSGAALEYVNQQTNTGIVAAQLAAYKGSAECLRLLAEAGADLASASRRGITAFSRALRGGHIACLEILCDWYLKRGLAAPISHFSHSSGVSMELQRYYRAEILHSLLWSPSGVAPTVPRERGADHRVIMDWFGEAFLQEAFLTCVLLNRPKCIALLLTYGAPLPAVDGLKAFSTYGMASATTEDVGGYIPRDLWVDHTRDKGLLRALGECGGSARELVSLIFRYCSPRRIRGAVALRPRRRAVLRWRRAIDARRDAACMFRAAAEGRPLELQKRVVLGQLAGGLEMQGYVSGEDGSVRVMGPLEAARMGGHAECVRVLEEATSIG